MICKGQLTPLIMKQDYLLFMCSWCRGVNGMSSKEEDASQLRAQLARKNDEIQQLMSQLGEKQTLITELNATIGLLIRGVPKNGYPVLLLG